MAAQKTNTDPVFEFRDALISAALQPGEIAADGKIRRCGTTAHPKSKNGWYVLYPDPFAGAFGDWSAGMSETWSYGGALSNADRERLHETIRQQKAEREAREKAEQVVAIEKARTYMASLLVATDDNPYLLQKGIKAYPGMLADGDDLIVPILGSNGQPMSYQRIDPTGGKRFAAGCPVAGGWFAIKGDNGSLLICEGIATGLSIHEANRYTVICAFSAGNLLAVARMARDRYPDRGIVIASDNDSITAERTGHNPGVEKATEAAMAISGLLAIPDQPGDWNDYHAAHSLDLVRTGIEAAKVPQKASISTIDTNNWPEPMPLPGLPPVAVFEMGLLPQSLQPWAGDISDRIQCPPDYVGITIMLALATVIGRKVGIRPQARTDWTVIPNMWGCLVGRPGVIKSPAMEAALAPLKQLVASANEKHEKLAKEYELKKVVGKLKAEAAEKAARTKLKKDPNADVTDLLNIEETEAPVLKRYIANDTTAPALGELHRQNQNGLMVFRDELVSLLQMLDRDDSAEARGFYLTGWNGDSPYTFDRITRGMNLHIPAVCLSLLGSTQPARISNYVRNVINGVGDDGLLQRFGMIVWPDISGNWKDVDRWPDSKAKRESYMVFERLDGLDPLSVGAKHNHGYDGKPDGVPYLRFDSQALGLFQEWRYDLEKRLRSGDLNPAFESHLAKYRKLIPGLALIIHLADGHTGPVTHSSVLQALAWGDYLETHATRLYASVSTPDVSAAKMILKKIRSRNLSSVMSVREIQRKQWSGLSDNDTIKSGLKLLVDHDWLFEKDIRTGGRPSIEYHVNPMVEVQP